MSDQATLEILIAIRSELADLNKLNQGLSETTEKATGIGQALKFGFGIDLARRGMDLLTHALMEFVKGSFEMAKQTKDSAANLNLSTEAYQVLRNVIIDAGGDVAQLSTALTMYRGTLDQVRAGTGKAGDEFRRLGLDVDELSKKPLELQLEQVAKAIFSTGNQTRAFDSAVQILGARNAPRLMGALRNLATEGYGKLSSEMENSGRIMKDVTIDQLVKAQLQIAAMKQELTIMTGEQIGKILSDNPTAISDAVKAITLAFEKGMETVQGLRDIYKSLTTGKSLQQIGWENAGDRSTVIKNKTGNDPVMATQEEASQARLLNLQQQYGSDSGDIFRTETVQRQVLLGWANKIVDAEKQISAQKYGGISLDADESTLTKAQLTQLQEKRKLWADIAKWQQEAAKLAGNETAAYKKIQDKYQGINDPHRNPDYLSSKEGPSAGWMNWLTSLGSEGQQIAGIVEQSLGQALSSIDSDVWSAIKGTQSWGQAWSNLGNIAGQMLTEMIIRMTVLKALTAAMNWFFPPQTVGTNTMIGTSGLSPDSFSNGQTVPQYGGGGTFYTRGRTNITVGDNPGGVELVSVLPLSGIGQTIINGQALRMAGGGSALVSGGASRGDTFNFSYAFQGGVSRQEVLGLIPKIVQASKSAVLDAQRRRRDGFGR